MPTVRVQMVEVSLADGADPIGRPWLQTHHGSAYHTWHIGRPRRRMPRCDVVPVAADQHGATGVTMRGLAGGIVDVAHIGVPKACVHGNPPRHAQGLRRCLRTVHQLAVRMERREV